MNRLKKMRKENNKTIAQVSEETGISKTSLTNYENEKRFPRDQKIWEELADYFGVPIAYLMGLTDTREFAIDIHGNGSLVKNDLLVGGNEVSISNIEIAKAAKKDNDKEKALENFLKEYLERDFTETELYGVSSFLSLEHDELKQSITDTIQKINLIDTLNRNTIEGLEHKIKNLASNK